MWLNIFSGLSATGDVRRQRPENVPLKRSYASTFVSTLPLKRSYASAFVSTLPLNRSYASATLLLFPLNRSYASATLLLFPTKSHLRRIYMAFFFVATKRFYKRVRPLVCLSVRRSVMNSLLGLLGVTDALLSQGNAGSHRS